MPQTLTFRLKEEELHEIAAVVKHDKRPEVRRRAIGLRLHMQKETGVELGPTQFRALLNENDFVYRLPKHDLTNLHDASVRQAAEGWLEELKKAPKRTNQPILYGQKYLRLAASASCLLDEARLPKGHCRLRKETIATSLWRL